MWRATCRTTSLSLYLDFLRLDEDAVKLRRIFSFFSFFFVSFETSFIPILLDRRRGGRKLQVLTSSNRVSPVLSFVDYHQEGFQGKNISRETKREHPRWNVDNRIFTTMHFEDRLYVNIYDVTCVIDAICIDTDSIINGIDPNIQYQDIRIPISVV